MHDKNYAKLVDFINSINYKVVNSDCDSWDFNTKIICNNHRRKSKYRIIYLSHECGHALAYNDKKQEYWEYFPGFSKNGIQNKISTLEQEVLAWDKGYRILKQLQIPFNIKDFARIKTKCLKEYL